MSIIAPDSTITLYQDVDITDEKQMIFQSVTEQNNYFSAHVYRTQVDCSYQKPGDPLILDIPETDLLAFNYISFNNESFENKTIYARVKNIPRYLNNEVRAIAYEIDTFQTFMFDINVEECSILREMMSTSEKTAEDTDCLKNEIAEYFTPEPLTYAETMKQVIDSLITQYTESVISGDIIRREYDLTASATPKKNGVFMNILNSHKLNTRTPSGADNMKCRIYLVLSQPFNASTGQTSSPIIQYNDAWGFTKVAYVTSYILDTTGLTDLANYIDAITTAGATNTILGMYWLPSIFPDSDRATPVQLVEHVITIPHNGKCGKLNRFPYRYIRMKDPSGNVKEYHLEKFDTTLAKNGSMTVTFGMFYTFNGYPQIILAPKNYGRVSTVETDVPVNYQGYNFKEGMIVADFPQVAFSTDAFLTYYGNVLRGKQMEYASASPVERGLMTTDLSMNRDFSSFGDFASEYEKYALGRITKGAGQLISGDIKGLGTMASIFSLGSMYNATQETPLNRQAADYSGTLMNVSSVDTPESLSMLRPAFANDEYHPSTNSAMLVDYMRNMVGFEMILIEPNDSLINQYEKFFEVYGFASNRFDVPRVMNYINNSGDMPVFYNNRTYVKTQNCHVNGVNIEVCRNIEAMFNAGHWFERVVNT